MITFGFGIFHFFEALNSSPSVRPPWRPGGAKILGVSLVGVGTLALILALVQYLVMLRYLREDAFVKAAGIPRFRPGLIVAVILTIAGVATFFALLVRIPG
jgi:uncharacterized membrane protein YidH (DUF202 family)